MAEVFILKPKGFYDVNRLKAVFRRINVLGETAVFALRAVSANLPTGSVRPISTTLGTRREVLELSTISADLRHLYKHDVPNVLAAELPPRMVSDKMLDLGTRFGTHADRITTILLPRIPGPDFGTLVAYSFGMPLPNEDTKETEEPSLSLDETTEVLRTIRAHKLAKCMGSAIKLMN